MICVYSASYPAAVKMDRSRPGIDVVAVEEADLHSAAPCQTLYVEPKPFLLEGHFMTQTVLVGATHQERFGFS